MRSSWNAGRSHRGDRPLATIGIVGALAICFLGSFFFSGQPTNPFFDQLAFTPDLSKPWTLLTYPFSVLVGRVFWFAIALWVTYQFMSDLERRLGAWGMALFFFAVTLLGGFGFFIGLQLFPTPSTVLSLNLPLEVVVFTWSLTNAGGQIMLFAVIPVPTRVLMWLCVAAVVIEHGWGSPFVGLFAALPLLVAWLYATDRIPFMRFGAVPDLTPKKEQKRDNRQFDSYMSDIKSRERERAEKERLRKMFESSLSDEDKDEKGR